MKKSIGIKLFIGITIFAIFIILLTWILNINYLDKYYIKKKKEVLLEYSKNIKINYNENKDLDYYKISNTINADISIVKLNKNNYEYVYPVDFYNGKGKGSGKGAMPLDYIQMKNILDGKDYLDIVVHPRLKTNFLVLSIHLKDNEILIIQSPIAPIKESVEVIKSLYIYIGLISIIIGMIVAFIFSKQFSKPIVELKNIAKKMGKLDFTYKYKVKSNDEIGELGKTINFLSDKLNLTITELNVANEELKKDIEKEKKIDTMRKEFISNVSHELKTPISLIQGYAEGLKDNVTIDEESKNSYCDVIIDESKKMDRLVKELLQLSKLESGAVKIKITKFSLSKLIENLIYKYNNILLERKIIIRFSETKNIYAYGDENKIEQVIVNFLNNAIDHLDNKKEIHLNIINIDEKIKIEIKNSGKLISNEEMNKIWDSFYKVDKSRNREYGGTGLGLSIVKAILNLHKNDYGVYNVEDGVVFWFELNKYV